MQMTAVILKIFSKAKKKKEIKLLTLSKILFLI